MAEWIVKCTLMNQQQSKEESIIIQYGADLIIENFQKLMIIIVAGFLIGALKETIIFLVVFCSLRFNAGGYHAQTGWGCISLLFCIWGIIMICDKIFVFSSIGVLLGLVITTFSFFIFLTPQTINSCCFTQKTIKRKKMVVSVMIIGYLLISFLIPQYQTIIVGAMIMEAATLLVGLKNIFR